MDRDLAVKKPGAGSSEVGLAAVLLGLLLLLQILVCHPQAQYRKGYWLDEYFTYVIASDPSWSHAMRAVRAGMDDTPPVYYAILRLAHSILGGEPISEYRACSTLAMWLALVCIYAALRYAVGRGAAAVAVLAIWAHPLMARYAFEGRSYSFWFAGTALTAWMLRLNGWARGVLLFLAAALTCSVHYFGVVSLYALLTGELLFGPGTISQRFWRIVPGILGPCVLLLWLPLILAQHRTIGQNWVAPFTSKAAAQLIEETFYAPMLALLLVGWGVSKYFYRSVPATTDLRPIAALFALIFLPVFFITWSLIGQPLLVNRYFLLALLGIAPLAAALVSEMGVRIKFLLGIAFIVLSTLMIHLHASVNAGASFYHDQIAAAAERPGNTYLLLFPTRHDLFELWFEHPELRPRLAMIDLSYLQLPRDAAFEQRLHRATMHLEDLPPIIDIRKLPPTPFEFIGDSDLLDALNRVVPLEVVDLRWQVYQRKK